MYKQKIFREDTCTLLFFKLFYSFMYYLRISYQCTNLTNAIIQSIKLQERELLLLKKFVYIVDIAPLSQQF